MKYVSELQTRYVVSSSYNSCTFTNTTTSTTSIPNMDNAPNTDDNNDGGSTTLTKMKNISSVIQYKIQSITKKYHWAMYKAFDTYNLNILWM